MASQALYRKWRSRTFEEVVAQEHVTHTLANALRSGRIAHAYLFTGPRGTGKTSTARLLAKAANCLGDEDGPRPCNRCSICLAVDEGRLIDLIEIDAASNRGIDEIRDLREKVNFRPNEARYKVYVIDEVHMLTNEAFNALLKTLEEPPGHVIFVLATTEPHKIPATVLSRCQRFDFRRIPPAAIVGRLRYIAEQEGIRAKEDALAFIARQSTGSLRDAVSLLDQLVAYDEETVTVEQVQQVLGLVPQQVVRKLVDCLIQGDFAGGLTTISQAIQDGADAFQLGRELVECLRGILLVKMSGDAALVNLSDSDRDDVVRQAGLVDLSRLIGWIKAFNQASLEMRLGDHPQLLLELAFVSVSVEQSPELSPSEPAVHTPEVGPAAEVVRSGGDAAQQPVGIPRAETPERTPAPDPRVAMQSEPVREASIEPEEKTAAAPIAGRSATLADVNAHWAGILAAIQQGGQTGIHRMVHALLQSSRPVGVKGDEVSLGFQHAKLAEKLSDQNRVAIVQDAIEQVLGVRLRVKCVVSSEGLGDSGGNAPAVVRPTENRQTQPTSTAPAAPVTRPESASDGNDRVERQASDGGIEYDDAIVDDQLIREAVEKFGARVSHIQILDEPEDEE